jgi:phytoene desaturase
MKNIIVIGSGFGGLSLAIRLQAQGYNVTILEKNEMLGGHAYQFKKNGYTFDMGPSLVTAPEIIQSVFESAGKKMEDYLDLVSLDPFYRIYFHDGKSIDYNGDAKKMSEQLAKFDKNDANSYNEFMDFSKNIYDAVITDGLGAVPFNKLSTMMNFLPRALQTKALFPAYNKAKKFFKSKEARFTFSFHPLFIGGNPFRVPSIYLMISYLEKKDSVWFTMGGMYSLVEAFKKIFEEKGGKIICNAEVSKILIENGKAIGVESKKGKFLADAVVSNADVHHTYSKLVDEKYRKTWTNKKLDNSKYSMSAFLLYIGSKKQYPELLHHTLVLSERYKELIDDIFDNKVLADDFSMYVHVPTRTDPSMAPENCDSIFVLAPVPNLLSGTNWETEKHKYADKIIHYLEHDFGMKDLAANIEVKEMFTPDDFKKERNSYLGTPWGMEPILLQSAYFRPHNVSEDVSNLFLVGAGTHPGGGLPGVMLSAEATLKVINEYFDKK